MKTKTPARRRSWLYYGPLRTWPAGSYYVKRLVAVGDVGVGEIPRAKSLPKTWGKYCELT